MVLWRPLDLMVVGDSDHHRQNLGCRLLWLLTV